LEKCGPSSIGTAPEVSSHSRPMGAAMRAAVRRHVAGRRHKWAVAEL
jgi:hypothetical protein